ncbi:MAG: iron-sulfur cluster assembly scaffold protein [Syntrophobacteraceae bacterium]|jgi:nitrogen fixation NifU-like protein
MDQKTLAFWRQHSISFLTMVLETNRCGKIQQADGYGMSSRECGDTLEIFLTARNGRISSAYFYTEGCVYTVACANTVVRMIEGKPVEEAWHILPRHISDYLETLPKAEMHCAELAVLALQVALIDLRKTERQPWTKFYRKG